MSDCILAASSLTASALPLQSNLETGTFHPIQKSEIELACAACIDLEKKKRGSGFITHPAVVDNAMQMGPAIGALASMSEDKSKALTRVVAGLSGYHGSKLPDRHSAFCASEMMPQGPDGEIYTSHWIIGAYGQKSLVIRDLKVWSEIFVLSVLASPAACS